MKNTLTLITCIAVCCATMVSCKNNNKKTAASQPTQEEIQTQKQALADSILAKIDAIVDQFADDRSNAFRFREFELTEEEKMVKPDYLLDPSLASTFVTKSQKMNALAMYLIDNGVRNIYGISREEAREAMTKLAAEVNFPVDQDYTRSAAPLSEKTKKFYEAFKERGDIAGFWQLQNAFMTEMSYIVAQNPELFFSKINEEQWQSHMASRNSWRKTVEELAVYDPEMAQILELDKKTRMTPSDEELEKVISSNQSIQSVKEYFIANKDKLIARRNALLQ